MAQPRRVRAILSLSVVALAFASLTACAPETQASAPAQSDILTMMLPSDVSAQGVVLAAVLLTTSDIELALSEGLVTPAEVDLAQAALDDGTLKQWQERAQNELATQQ